MNKTTVKPKLRFPEFVGNPKWSVAALKDFSTPITKRAGAKKYTLLSVTSGVGLVSQLDKFGREIAGSSYKNYIVIEQGDFAYNKSATKLFPEGYIARLNDYDKGAVPNSIFTCFRATKKQVDVNFIDHIFQSNYHGSWLRKFIAVGARAHGALNIDDKYLWELPVALPTFAEQQKIANCLSSLDDLIAAENKKLDILKAHKKGLMQKLFPAEGKSVPEWRFPEFRGSGEWKINAIGKLSGNIVAGGTPSTLKPEYWNGHIRWMSSGDLNLKRVYEVKGRITEEGMLKSSTKLVPSQCVLIGLAGQGKTRGTVAMNMVELCVNQSIAAIFPNQKVFASSFLYHNLDYRYEELRKLSTGDGGRGGLNLQILKSLPIYLPSIVEQQEIADCLSVLDKFLTAQAEKIETLKLHKKGLMQGLFPSAQEVME